MIDEEIDLIVNILKSGYDGVEWFVYLIWLDFLKENI